MCSSIFVGIYSITWFNWARWYFGKVRDMRNFSAFGLSNRFALWGLVHRFRYFHTLKNMALTISKWVNINITWLVVWNMAGLFSISYMGCHPKPIDELIFFKMVKTTNPNQSQSSTKNWAPNWSKPPYQWSVLLKGLVLPPDFHLFCYSWLSKKKRCWSVM